VAAILAALDAVRPADTGILFSGDEEFSSVVMKDFVAGARREGLERAIVCEPRLRKRGYANDDDHVSNDTTDRAFARCSPSSPPSAAPSRTWRTTPARATEAG
jgi:hypothetical protein